MFFFAECVGVLLCSYRNVSREGCRGMYGRAVAVAVSIFVSAPAGAAEPFLDGPRGNCLLCDLFGNRVSKARRDNCPPAAPSISEQRNKEAPQEAESKAPVTF